MVYIRYIISKKIVLFFLVISIILSYSAPINAQQADNSNSLASVSDNLNKLGLLSGDGNGNYNLDSNLKRTEAMTFLAKLMGKYEYIQKNRDTLKKTKFKDVAETDWFAPYVGFCYSNNIVSGYGNQLFGSKDNITEQAFLVMVLKLLKYDDIKWNDNVFKKAYEVGLVADKAYLSRTKDNNNSYTRGKAVISMNTALSTKINGQSKTLIQSLINDGAVKADIAKSLGYDTVEKTDNTEKTEPTKDTIALKINEILSVSTTEIAVKLNTELKSISNSNILIYEAGNKNNTLNISSVTSSGTKLIITTGTQVPGKSYNVELINIKDSKGNILSGLTGSFSGYAQIIMPPAGVVTPPSTPPTTPPSTPPSPFVDSITALNAKQIQIVFIKEMVKLSVEDINFYEIQDKGTDVISLAQGAIIYNEFTKTAVITLNNKISDKLTNLTTAKVTVKKGIKSITGLELAKNVEFNVKVEDLIAPAFRSFEVTGNKSLKITFSEPVYDGTNNTLLDFRNFIVSLYIPKYLTDMEDIDFQRDFIYHVQKVELSGDSITLFFTQDLVEGKMLVTFNAAGTDVITPIQDYSGNKVLKKSLYFDYIKDGSRFSEVTVKNASEYSVTLGFSKPVTAENLKLFHSDKNITANMSNPVYIEEETFVKEITFKFPNKIPIGATDLFLVNSTDPSRKMINIYGEYVQDQTLIAEVAPDTTPPYVTKTELYSNKHFTIYFNELVSRSFAENPANYDFRTFFYFNTISFIPILNDDGKSVKLYLPKGLRDNTQYNVVVRNAEDLSRNKISSNITLTFTSMEQFTPTLELNKCCTINSEGKIKIYFSEPMNEARMLDKYNYWVATTSGAIFTPLGTADTVTKASDRSVLIDMSKTVDSPSVIISNIRDLSGKELYNLGGPVYINDINEESVYVKSVDLIAKNKIKITFSTEMKTFSTSDISFTGVTDSAIHLTHLDSRINDDDNTEFLFGLDKEFSTDAKYNGCVISAITKEDCDSKTVFGTKLTPSQTISIKDKVAPEVITYDHDSDDLTEPVEKVVLSGDILTSMVDGKVPKDTTGTITISYSEPIDSHTIYILAYIVDGYTVTSISNGEYNNEVVLSIKANSDNTPARTTVKQIYYIYDYSYNGFSSDKVWTVR